MEGFEIIDSHIHLTRNLEEESNYWLFPGRRACDRYGTPERAIEYMNRVGISRMCFLTLIPRQFRGPLVEKANLPSLPDSELKSATAELGSRESQLELRRLARDIDHALVNIELMGAFGGHCPLCGV